MDGWTHKLPFYGTDFGPPHLPVSFSAGVPLVRHHHCFNVLHKGAAPAELVFPHAASRKDTIPFHLPSPDQRNTSWIRSMS